MTEEQEQLINCLRAEIRGLKEDRLKLIPHLDENQMSKVNCYQCGRVLRMTLLCKDCSDIKIHGKEL